MMRLSISSIETLRQRLMALAADPGLLAHSRAHGRAREVPVGAVPRRSAVLLALYQADGQIWLPLIVRPQYEGVHSGQVAFPGGKYEDADGSMEHTALRETREEVGIQVQPADLLGKLTEIYIPPSNSLVTPVVAWLPFVPSFTPDRHEVAAMLPVPLAHLRNPAHWGQKHIQLANGHLAPFHAYLFEGQEIWGATAYMIGELLELTEGIVGLDSNT